MSEIKNATSEEVTPAEVIIPQTEYKDLAGQRFGRWTVLFRIENTKKPTLWFCQCDCGVQKPVRMNNLTSGRSKSCGCLKNEMQTTHGMHGERIYSIWENIKQRCLNPSSPNYKYYGGRGVLLCAEWQEFEPFYSWSISHGYSADLSIDRIDSNSNYEPSNCRWVTTRTQARNRRSNHNITIDGKTHCFKDWCELSGISPNTAYYRIKRGMSVAEAVTRKQNWRVVSQ